VLLVALFFAARLVAQADASWTRPIALHHIAGNI